MINTILKGIVGVLTGCIILFIPNFVANTMTNSPYEGSFYSIFFVTKCIFMLLGLLMISYVICFLINKEK